MGAGCIDEHTTSVYVKAINIHSVTTNYLYRQKQIYYLFIKKIKLFSSILAYSFLWYMYSTRIMKYILFIQSKRLLRFSFCAISRKQCATNYDSVQSRDLLQHKHCIWHSTPLRFTLEHYFKCRNALYSSRWKILCDIRIPAINRLRTRRLSRSVTSEHISITKAVAVKWAENCSSPPTSIYRGALLSIPTVQLLFNFVSVARQDAHFRMRRATNGLTP